MSSKKLLSGAGALLVGHGRRWTAHLVVASVAASMVLGASCRKDSGSALADAAVAVRNGPSTYEIAETVFEHELKSGWQDYGWSPRKLTTGGPAELDFSDWGGWIIAKPNLQPGAWGALVFHVKAPAAFGDFLEVRVDSDQQNLFPRIQVSNEQRRLLPDGWQEILLPMSVLNPEGLPFDRIVIRAHKRVGAQSFLFDHLLFTKGHAATGASSASPAPSRPASMSVDCSAPASPIQSTIYGIAYHFRHDSTHRHQWELGATARRWGGNPASRYNWRLGNAWNTGSDWYYENVNLTGNPAFSYRDFLRDNASHQVKSVLTVPLIGWVAKDTTSSSFPPSVFGEQQSTDSYRPDAGNGKDKSGKLITPGPPTRTSVAAPPEMIADWVKAIRDEDQKTGKRSVYSYILGNEPMLWHETHRDVHPDPVSYDELLDRTIRYGSAIRKADPDAVIAGPALWGWTAYLYSAKDGEMGYRLRPDRRMHGDEPLLPWYLKKLAEYEKQNGVRILDLVDVHFYPQAKRVFSNQGGTDRATSALRFRSTRALWDPTYVDESWIKEAVRLIPRVKEWIAQSYPGRGISIGEYNFGAEQHISGGLALAEALGRFGQLGVTSAYYWTYPEANSPAYWAFRAYRNFDGKGSRFQDLSVPTRALADTSLFASRDADKRHIVLIALNPSPDSAADATIDIGTCGSTASYTAYSYTGGAQGFKAGRRMTDKTARIRSTLPPNSINVIDIQIASP